MSDSVSAAVRAAGPEGPIREVREGRGPLPVQAVLLDFSGTVFQIASYASRIRAVLGGPVAEDAMEALLDGLEAGLADPVVAAAQQGRDTSAKAHRHAFTTWYGSVPALAPHAEALYEQLRTPEYWVPYADAEGTLAALARRGVAVGVVSDIGWDLRATFAHHGLDGYVGSWVHSFEHGTEKPDPALFTHACRELGVAPEEALMVGDNPVKDGGAVGAGLRAYVLQGGGVAPGARRGLGALLRLTETEAAEAR